MVAFELARAYETENRNEEALAWYIKSYERFRRDDWKKKAAEAITRLGSTPPISAPTPPGSRGDAVSSDDSSAMPATPSEFEAKPVRPFGAGLPSQLFHSARAQDAAT